MPDIFRYVKKSTVCFLISITAYFCISKVIFDNVYLTSNMVVDEEFHVALGQAYCELDFSKWDPKITTLPGLYLVSTMILAPFEKCSVYWLRLVSLLASVVNIFFFYDLKRQDHQATEWRNILASLTLALLPPLYFFSHLYYTDVTALTMTLAMIVLSERDYHFAASLFGLFSVLCRQTNIIWVALVTGKYCLGEFHRIAMHRSIPRGVDEYAVPDKNFFRFITLLWRNPSTIPINISIQFLLDFASYLTLLLTFVVFVISNGSIVVGDKTAHEVALHLPQLFYFSLFCLVFAWPYFVEEIINFMVFARRHKLLISGLIVVGLFIVYANTLVHPYLLADNRHYFFYLWNRFYGKYSFFRYFMVPVYIFAWYVIIKRLYDRNDIRFFILYLPSVFIVLITQKLIDVRYYFIPYILFRLNIKDTTSSVFNVVLEFVTYCVINAIAFNLFFTKPIIWDDYEIPQRLIW